LDYYVVFDTITLDDNHVFVHCKEEDIIEAAGNAWYYSSDEREGMEEDIFYLKIPRSDKRAIKAATEWINRNRY